ncbi:MAG: hypothetical protein K6E21_03505 [Bacilli bacterium]|nr:hypothetical protein [Bacilli bacterium]
MKKLFLLLTTLMLSACGGPSSNSSSGNNDKQNFVYDASGNLIDGKVFLILTDEEKVDKAYETYEKRDDLTKDEKLAYKLDLKRLNSTELCQIVYDTERTGSFTYKFDVKKVLGDYMVNDTTLDVTKRKLYVSFVPTNAGSNFKTVKFSNFSMKARIEYQLNTGKGIKNISREKSGTGAIYQNTYTKDDWVFKNTFIMGDINPGILEVDEDYRKIEGDATLTFSGTLTAKF